MDCTSVTLVVPKFVQALNPLPATIADAGLTAVPRFVPHGIIERQPESHARSLHVGDQHEEPAESARLVAMFFVAPPSRSIFT